MKRLLFSLTIAICLGGVCLPVAAQIVPPRTIAIENVRVKTMDGPDIGDGVLVVRGGRILAVGAAGEVQVPPRATRIDGGGGTVTPGIIDVLGGIGLTGSGGGEATHRAFDAFDRYARSQVEQAWRQGVTTIFLSAGSTGVSGTGAVISLAQTATDALGEVLAEDSVLCVGLEAGSATARLRALQSLRGQFKSAQAYRESIETYEEELAEYEKLIAERAEAKDDGGAEERPSARARGGRGGQGPGLAEEGPGLQDPRRRGGRRGGGQSPPADPSRPQGQGNQATSEIKKPNEPAPNHNAEILLRAMDAELPVRLRADRSETILNALDFAREFSLRITIEGGAEAHLVARELAEQGVSVIYDSAPGGTAYRSGDTRRFTPDAPRVLVDAGVPWSIGTGSSSSGAGRFVLLNAMLASESAPAVDAFALVTSQAADVLGLENVGRLRAGTRADIVLWSGDPAEPGSRVIQVFVGGDRVYERGLGQ